MAFCPNCGNQIPDGGVCPCQSGAMNMNNNPMNMNNGPVNQNYNPYAQPSNQGGGVQLDQKKQLILYGCIAAGAIVVLVLLFNLLFGGGYKKPIKQVIKGFNHNNAKKIAYAMYPKEYIKDELEDEDDFDWDDADDAIEDSKEYFEDEYGEDIKIKVKFLDKKDVKKKELEKLEDMYDDVYDAEVKKAYKVKVEMTIKGDDDDDDSKVWLYVVKLKGDGWKLAPYGSGASMFSIY